MKNWAPVFSVASLLLPLAAADCDKFTFLNGTDASGQTEYYNNDFTISSYINCTADTATQVSGNKTVCEYQPYGAGLVAHPQIRNVTISDDDDREDIFELVQEMISDKASATTNFNLTIVMNHTAGITSFGVGDSGYVAFMPMMRCWEGTLSDCDDDDNLEGKTARVCGLKWLDEFQSSKDAGVQTYDGTEYFVGTDTGNGIQSSPPYSDVANQATNDDDDSAATRSLVSGMAVMIALMSLACAVLL
ncbi:uncharacterized protein F4822DRAFT_2289 [Hypoxylon trugodes]|uniref:uncharacterized protein n=1 Tax=Hypoxylon trugodes TaxID=326681 RepID=UPI00218FB7E0|nr:uncharacterized protein F4822DRAFT_2289 [Hypoxylon trugodes]KAI1393163.1 hypothetical protein F4822DRAFT_2289 [Hypoxylon trugodes]